MTHGDTAANDDTLAGGASRRQLVFVSLLALALLAAAFVAPPLPQPGVDAGSGSGTGSGSGSGPGTETQPGTSDEPGSGPSGRPGAGGGSNTGTPGEPGTGSGDGSRPGFGPDTGPNVDPGWTVRLPESDGGGSSGEAVDGAPGERTDGQPGARVDDQCSIRFDRQPTPGSVLTVAVYDHGVPIVDAVVWFNDHRVGITDADGSIAGVVPYDRQLHVRVDVPDGTDCPTPETDSTAAVAGSSHLAIDGPRDLTTTGVAVGSTLDGARLTGASPTVSAPTSSVGASANVTVEFEVAGSVTLNITGEPYPGETIDVEATIEGVSMREASVDVDGEPVGVTDERGRIDVRVPDDGSERFTVTVTRGDFAGSATVDVLVLQAALVPDGVALVPGAPASVEATVGGEPVEDAVVSVDGEHVGTTDARGRLGIDLPVDPTTPVTVTTERQTVSVSLLSAYRWVLVALVIVVVALSTVAYRRRGVRGVATVLATVGALGVVVVVDAFWGPTGTLVVLGVLATALLAGVAIRWRSTLSGGVRSSGSSLARFVEWLVGLVLSVVSLIEALLAWIGHLVGRFTAWLTSLPRSGSALLDRVLAWARSLPARSRATLGRLSLIPVATLVGAVVTLVVAYVVAGTPGVVVVVLCLLFAVAVFRWRTNRVGGTSADGTSRLRRSSTADPRPSVEREVRRSLRARWRAFARRVVPDGWRSHAPGEVARAALDQGYPHEPVRAVTTAFCEVEYGNRPLSVIDRDRVEEAYDDIEAYDARRTGSGERSDPFESAGGGVGGLSGGGS